MTGEHDLEAAEFVLGTLDANERRAFAARLENEPGVRAAVAAWETRLSPLAETVTPVTPPATVWTKIERGLARDAAAPVRLRLIEGGGAAIDPSAELRRAVRRWRALAAVSSAAAAVLLIFTGIRLAQEPPAGAAGETAYVAAVNRGGDQPALIVRVDLKTHQVYVRPVAAEAPQGRSLELWYISDGKPPRSMGLVTHAPLSIPLPKGTHAEDATFAVSVEPPGGSPTGTATGPVIYAGQLVKE